MTVAMQNLSSVLFGVKMAEKITLAVQSKSNYNKSQKRCILPFYGEP